MYIAQITSPTPTLPANPTVSDLWVWLVSQCQTQMPAEQCNALLGVKPIYYPPSCVDKPKVRWWVFLVIGFIAGRFI